MNHKEALEPLNYIARFLIVGEMRHLNCIRLNSSCSDKHNDEIIRRCKEYLKIGTQFLTEVNLVRGGRADILIPHLNLIEEIMVSESDDRFHRKNYSPFKVVQIRI